MCCGEPAGEHDQTQDRRLQCVVTEHVALREVSDVERFYDGRPENERESGDESTPSLGAEKSKLIQGHWLEAAQDDPEADSCEHGSDQKQPSERSVSSEESRKRAQSIGEREPGRGTQHGIKKLPQNRRSGLEQPKGQKKSEAFERTEDHTQARSDHRAEHPDVRAPELVAGKYCSRDRAAANERKALGAAGAALKAETRTPPLQHGRTDGAYSYGKRTAAVAVSPALTLTLRTLRPCSACTNTTV